MEHNRPIKTHLSVPQELTIRQRNGDPKPEIDTQLPDGVHVYLKHACRRAHGKHGSRVLEREQRRGQRLGLRTLQIVISRSAPFTIARRRRRQRGTDRRERTERKRVRTRGRVVPQRAKRSREQAQGGGRRRSRRGRVMRLRRQHELGDGETRLMSELVELRVDDARRRGCPRARMGRCRRGWVRVRRGELAACAWGRRVCERRL